MKTLEKPEPEIGARKRAGIDLIDVDVHQYPATPGQLWGYMPPKWRHYVERFGKRGPSEGHYTAYGGRRPGPAARVDSWPEKGMPGSDYDFMRRQLLDRYDMKYAVLGTTMQLEAAAQPRDLSNAMTCAINDWTKADWLTKDKRLLASICPPFEYSKESVTEIERWAQDPQFVSILFNGRTERPMGHPKYWDIYEAAEARGLAVECHVAGLAGNMMTAVGIPSYYIEGHTGHVQDLESHFISLICEGVFDRFPKLQVMLVEGGFSWVGPMQWRMDNAYKLLSEEVGRLARKPSEYVHENFWFTTQPMEEPGKPGQLMQVIEDAGIADRLLFATDYPHWDFDSPEAALSEIKPELHEKIFSGNAKRLMNLP